MEEQIKKMVSDVQSGIADPLQTFLLLKNLEEVCKESKQKISQSAMTEIQKFGDKITIGNYTLTKCNVSTTYNFSKCSDSIFEVLESEFELSKKRLDDRKDFLKALRTQAIEQETGEIINPPLKIQIEGIKVTKK